MNPYIYPDVMGKPITREEIMAALRDNYEAAIHRERLRGNNVVDFPDMVAILNHIDQHGLPPRDV